jgi:hypothetical protein
MKITNGLNTFTIDSLSKDMRDFNLEDYRYGELALGEIVLYNSYQNYDYTKYNIVELVVDNGKFFVRPASELTTSPILGVCLDEFMVKDNQVRVIQSGITKVYCEAKSYKDYEGDIYLQGLPGFYSEITQIKATSMLTLSPYSAGIAADSGMIFMTLYKPTSMSDDAVNADCINWGFRYYLCSKNDTFCQDLLGIPLITLEEAKLKYIQSQIDYYTNYIELDLGYKPEGYGSLMGKYGPQYLSKIFDDVVKSCEEFLKKKPEDYIISYSDINQALNSIGHWYTAMKTFMSDSFIGVVLEDTELSEEVYDGPYGPLHNYVPVMLTKF